MAATAAAVAFGGTTTAAAAPAHPADRGSAVTKRPVEHTITFKMTTVRVTELVTRTPDRAGNVTVRLANGKTIPIPADTKDLVMRRAAQQAKSQFKAAEPRPCGITWVKLKEKSNHHPFAMETGFDVLGGSAIGYRWRVTIKGPNNYAHEYTSQGNLAWRDSWQGGYTSDKDQDEGLYTAEVDPGVSHFQFTNREICVAEPARRTERLTKPKAACLKVMDPNSGGGWILNTTKEIKLRNQSEPTGPKGDRAAGAEACLTKNLGAGSTAEGGENVTGWLDAKKFRDTYSPGTSLARCHLIANNLGGKGKVRDGGLANLVPCWQVGMNTGTPSMRTNEMKVEKVVKKPAGEEGALGPDDAVHYKVMPLYKDDDSTIPTGVLMSASVQRADGTGELLFTADYVPNTKDNTGLLNLGN
ncbi:DNA/RNA non-specific endonuclease [Streptomyces luteireticuli]|uniref:Type VII secretion system protein EssD-like domain-containing protein n=1 Tax=Streptomyces luteireticuli TaxID=173858 RepID=A0ABP3ICE6_9ACTN